MPSRPGWSLSDYTGVQCLPRHQRLGQSVCRLYDLRRDRGTPTSATTDGEHNSATATAKRIDDSNTSAATSPGACARTPAAASGACAGTTAASGHRRRNHHGRWHERRRNARGNVEAATRYA